jgi:hypothetical protein
MLQQPTSRSTLTTSPDKNDPDLVARFRSLTYYTSCIQQCPDRPIYETTEPSIDANETVELKLVSAFAALGVVQHEVLAVAINKSDLYRSDAIQVIVSVSPTEMSLKVHQSSLPNWKNRLANFLNRALNVASQVVDMVVTRNTREEEYLKWTTMPERPRLEAPELQKPTMPVRFCELMEESGEPAEVQGKKTPKYTKLLLKYICELTLQP